MNTHANEFLGLLQRRYAHDKSSMTMSDWIVTNTKLNGRPFSFVRYPFQRQIADDMHPNLDVIKPSQVGMTEIQIRKVLAWLKRTTGITAIYTLPDDDMFKRVAQGRIQPLVEKDPVFHPRKGEKQVRSRDIMQFGDSWLYLTGASEGDATSIPADGVFNDEVDLTDQEMLALFNSRLQGSNYKINQRFSTPTFTNFGIDLSYTASDQHEFFVRCDACNHWQVPDFTPRFVQIDGLSDNVADLTEIDEKMIDGGLDIVNACVVCEQCRNPLDLGREDNRAWVPKHPSRTHARGYKVRPFSTNRLPPSYIITQLLQYKRREAIRRFHNTVLGNAYTGEDERLTEEQIKAACVSPKVLEVGRDVPTWLGIDIGLICHLAHGVGMTADDMEVIQLMSLPYTKLFETVEFLRESYNVIGGIIDRLPYTPTANAIRDASEWRIMPGQYTGKKELSLAKSETDTPDFLHVDRTQSLDTVFGRVKRRELKINGYGNLQPVLVEHLRDMVREEEPEKQAIWKKLTGSDHFFHALGYLHLAPRAFDLVRTATTDDKEKSALLFSTFRPADVDARRSILGVPERRGVRGPLG